MHLLFSPQIFIALMIYQLLVLKCLQMPTREACHVAVQKSHPSKQRLWKHALARQNAKGQGPTPVLQIVCEYLCPEVL